MLPSFVGGDNKRLPHNICNQEYSQDPTNYHQKYQHKQNPSITDLSPLYLIAH